MIFEDDFLDSLPDQLNQALGLFCEVFFAYERSIPQENEIEHYADYVDSYYAIVAFLTSQGLQERFTIVELDTNNKLYNIQITQELYSSIRKFVESLNNISLLEASKFKYNSKFTNLFSYKFSDGDLNKIQELINDLRAQINESNFFSLNHKGRLLNRLENLQKELHKRMSNLDKFWGLIGDAGVILGKFGNDVKPLVDRIKEITEIVWRTQAAAEELPSGSSMPMIN